ncbi:MAG: hypothetical protein Q7R70_05720 [Candidatus Diapherotrites archaeon]|nr:hypothetical protein [Candidatus Diapherotrites archaeon]
MRNKAFIGPIGDDLPSLIPIVFALTIFFASFNAALSTFDSKNNSFADDLDALKVARIMRSNGYIVNKENFDQLCGLVEVRSLKFVAGLAEFNTTPEDSLDPLKPYNFTFFEPSGLMKPIDQLFYGNASGNFYCTNLKDPSTFDSGVLQYKNAIVRTYPVILEKDRGTDAQGGKLGIIAAPMQLVVVAWR